MGKTTLVVVADGERRMIGPFDVEFIPVTHSVPHAHAIAIHTPQGVILHSGDFKLDLTPVDGRRTDLARIGSIASNEGIRLLLADSTNAEERGHAPSETSVGAVLRGLFAEQRGQRIITASFASHLHRIQQIADAAIAEGRVVATLGLSMKKNVRMGRDLGVVTIPDKSLVDIDDIDKYPPGQVCVISTGSQGEPMSALALLGRGENKWVKIGETDTVILSSHAIPGNEGNVNRVIDGLLRAGAQVIHSHVADVHATGHAQAEDLKTYLSLTQPDYFVPIHGEYRHMVANAKLGYLMGVPRDHVLVCEDGDVLTLDDGGLAATGRVPAGYLYVDGIVGDVGQGVLRDRKMLAEEGVVVVVVTVDIETGKVLVGPEIITRGWVYAPEAEDLLDEACDAVADAVEKTLAAGVRDVDALERDVRRAAGKFVNERTKRRPMIVPVVMEA
jgi:ribonuclease J